MEKKENIRTEQITENRVSELEAFLNKSKEVLGTDPVGDLEPEGLSNVSSFPVDSQYCVAFLRKIRDKALIKDFEDGSEYEDFSVEKLIELSRYNYDLVFNAQEGTLGVEKDGLIIDKIEDSVNFGNPKEIAPFLPDVTFDITQGGVRERSIEAEAAYKLVVAASLMDNAFTESLGRCIQNFDFKDFSSKKESFSELLTRMQPSLNETLRVVIAACNIKLFNAKTKKEQRIYKLLTPSESSALNDLDIQIRILRNKSEKELK